LVFFSEALKHEIQTRVVFLENGELVVENNLLDLFDHEVFVLFFVHYDLRVIEKALLCVFLEIFVLLRHQVRGRYYENHLVL
jgi:hypothetical protein